MIHLIPAFLCVASFCAPSQPDALPPSHAAARCASAIDELVVKVNAVAVAWEKSADFHGWSPSLWPSEGVPELVRLLDESSDVFTRFDAITSDPSLHVAVGLTKRIRTHGAPSLMETRNVCDVLCARSVICASRGETIEAVQRLDQAVQLTLAMTRDSDWDRSMLASLSGIWLDTLAALFTVPSFDPIAARAQLDARLAGISRVVDADVEHANRVASISKQRVLANAQLIRSALAVSAFRRERGRWPASVDEAFADLDGESPTDRDPSELTCLRRTSFGVRVLALVDAPQSSALQRLSITLREPSSAVALQ